MANALLVKNGKLERIEIKLTDHMAIHELVGNWFTTCFNVPGESESRTLTGYCDDEGLLHGEPDWNVVCDWTLRTDAQPIAGPIVIMGTDAEGESVALTEREMAAFTAHESLFAVNGKALGILAFDPLDD